MYSCRKESKYWVCRRRKECLKDSTRKRVNICETEWCERLNIWVCRGKSQIKGSHVEQKNLNEIPPHISSQCETLGK